MADWLGEHLHLSGWLETSQGGRVYSPDEALTSRLQARVEAAIDWGPLHAFTSLDAEKNWIIEDNTQLAVREAWLEYVENSWSLRVGRQLIVWGKADALRITDNVCPVDYSDFMNRQRDEVRIPVAAALLRFSGEIFSTDLIWIPEFRPAAYPGEDAPWGPLFSLGDNPLLYERSPERPAFSLENSEIGVRASGYFSAFDASASALYTWDDMPVYDSRIIQSPQGLRIEVTPKHKRVTILGLDASIPYSDFVFRGEGALFLGKHITASRPGLLPSQKAVIKWLAGMDWSPGNDWMLIAQISDEQILIHENGLAQKKHRHIATLNVSKKFMNQTLTISNTSYLMLDDSAIAGRFQAEYSIMDGMTISAGVDLIEGGDGRYSEFRENSQAWIKIRYSF